MESFKSTTKYQRSLRSMFSLTRKWNFLNNQNYLLISSLNIFKLSIEYIFFKWNLFYYSLKTNYLVQLITFNQISNYFSQKSHFIFLEKTKKSRSKIMLFFNIPFLISTLLFEISESIKKKTVYLYRFVLFLSIPVLLFCGNNTFIIHKKKDYLSFILTDKKNIYFDEKFSIFVKNYKKEFFHNCILNSLYHKIQKVNTLKEPCFFEKRISYLSYLPNSYKNSNLNKSVLSYQLIKNKTELIKKNTKDNNEKILKCFNWFFLYIKIKKNYSRNFPTNCATIEKILKNIWIAKSLQVLEEQSLGFLKFGQLFKKKSFNLIKNYYEQNRTDFFQQERLEKFDRFFFSLIKPIKFNYLKTVSIKNLSNRHSVILDIVQLQNEEIHSTNFFSEQNENKQQWILTIKHWNKIYPSQNKFLDFSFFSKNIKENLKLLQNFKFVIYFFTKIFQKVFGKPLLNKANFSSFFLKKKQLPSYKNALKENNLNFKNSIFVLRNKNEYLEYFPLFIKNFNSKITFQKINFLYNFSLRFGNDYIFLNPEVSFFLNKDGYLNSVGRVENDFQSFLFEDAKLYDLDFYLKNYKQNCDLFSVPSSSIEKNLLEQQEKKHQKHKIVSNFNETLISSRFQQDLDLIKIKRENLQNIFNTTNLCFRKKYDKWIFTTQWWFFVKYGILYEIQMFIDDLNHIRKIILHHISYINKNKFLFNDNFKAISIFLSGSRVGDPGKNIFISELKDWNKLIFERVYTGKEELNLWRNGKLVPLMNNSFYSFFAWFLASSIIYYHWIPVLTGVIYVYFWLDFEKIRSLSYPSWKTSLSILIHNRFDSPTQQLKLVGYSSKGRLFSLYSEFYKKWSAIFSIFNRLNYSTTLDLSRRNKNVISNSFITKKSLQSKYSFCPIDSVWKNTRKEHDNGIINGLNFLEKWCEKNSRISSFMQNTIFTSFSLNWLNNLFFYNTFFIFNLSSHSNIVHLNSKAKPLPLLEPLVYTQRWLLIGSIESEKYFAIKKIAASTHYSLIHISIKDIKNATPDVKYNKIRKHKRWVEQLSERSFYLENIFKLAKIMVPSMFWISDLHDFHPKNQIEQKNTQRVDVSLLLSALLRILSTEFIPEKKNAITFVGSTEYPRLLDPKFVSRQRLDLIVNFRPLSFNQRQHIYTLFLKNNGFTIRGVRSFYELCCNTLGYTFRDITSLVNETLLIKTTEKNTLIDSNTIKLACYRQTSTQSIKYKIVTQENLAYKIGKALVQALLVYPKSLVLLSKYQELWKTKFYYLSTTYLEVSSKKTIITEIVLFTQIVNCLAGSSARDAWFLSKRNLEKLPFSLTTQIKHDFLIASNILQSLLMEFPMRGFTCVNRKKEKNCHNIAKTFHFTFIKKATSYLDFFYHFPSYINWSIKEKRISFNWILFFIEIEHSTKNLVTSLFFNDSQENTFSSNLDKGFDRNLPYERKETKRQEQKIQTIDLVFNKMIYTMSMEYLGFPWESQYVLDYNPFQISLFFREARPLWNPQTKMPSYSILFFDRDLVINQKLLTKLYITYGNKFQTEKLNRKRIKKSFLWPNSSFNKVAFDKKSEKKDSVQSLNRTQGSTLRSQRGVREDFHFYQNLILLNSQLDQSQIQAAVYFHQEWITADPKETFRTFDILFTQILLNNNASIAKESFLFEILLEIYHYLIKFFLKKKFIITNIKEILMKNEILYRQDIENSMIKYD